MDNLKNKKIALILIYLDRNLLQVYVSGEANVGTIAMPLTTVSDLEVKSPDELKQILGQMMLEKKISAGQVYLLLSPNLVYEKNYEGAETVELIKDNEHFAKDVPFEHVKTRVYRQNGGGKVVATNRDFYESLMEVLIRVGLTVEAVTPVTVLGEKGLEKELTAETAKLLVKKTAWLAQNSFMEESAQKAAEEQTGSDPRKNKRLLGLMLVLGALLVVLIFAVVKSRAQPRLQAKAPVKVAKTAPAKITEEEATAAGEVNPAEISIQIINNSGVFGQTDKIKKSLSGAGFTQAESEPSTNVITGESWVYFSPNVPPGYRVAIINLLSPLVGGVSTKETADINYDVVITINKSTKSGT